MRPTPVSYAQNKSHAQSHRVPRTLWIGIATLVIGVGPLFATILAARLGLTSDPNPNPVGFGILAGISFWPGLALTVAGLATMLNARPREL